VADIIALAKFSRLPALCVDAGTAVTVDLVAEDGEYVGGLILPGATLMARSLAEGTARLPLVGPGDHELALARATTSAIAVGSHWGCIAMIGGLLNLLEARGYRWRTLVLTGGFSPRISPCLSRDHHVDLDLCFKGLAIVWEAMHAGAHTG
jgi:type III pantothenate kinase